MSRISGSLTRGARTSLLAPVTATALLATYPLASLIVCVPTGLATALAIGNAVPPWSVALGVALCVISFLTGRRVPRAAPALTAFAVGAVVAVPLALIAGSPWVTATGLLLLNRHPVGGLGRLSLT